MIFTQIRKRFAFSLFFFLSACSPEAVQEVGSQSKVTINGESQAINPDTSFYQFEEMIQEGLQGLGLDFGFNQSENLFIFTGTGYFIETGDTEKDAGLCMSVAAIDMLSQLSRFLDG